MHAGGGLPCPKCRGFMEMEFHLPLKQLLVHMEPTWGPENGASRRACLEVQEGGGYPAQLGT